jgi:phospholipase/carboxylesterase
MRETKLGPLTVRIAGGDDHNGGGDGPVVVLMHGFGAPGADLVALHRVLDVAREVRWVFPAAPLEMPAPYGMDSRAWWMIDIAALDRAMATGEIRDLSRSHPEGLTEARAQVIEMLDALDRELAPQKLVLGGFSQGAMLALDTALHDDRALAGLVLWSGTLLAEDEWVPRLAARKGTRVIQSHGSADRLLPFSLAERLRDHLKTAGWEHTWVPFRGMHEIPHSVLDATAAFLRAC